jgi:hypothetical protein
MYRKLGTLTYTAMLIGLAGGICSSAWAAEISSFSPAELSVSDSGKPLLVAEGEKSGTGQETSSEATSSDKDVQERSIRRFPGMSSGTSKRGFFCSAVECTCQGKTDCDGLAGSGNCTGRLVNSRGELCRSNGVDPICYCGSGTAGLRK